MSEEINNICEEAFMNHLLKTAFKFNLNNTTNNKYKDYGVYVTLIES